MDKLLVDCSWTDEIEELLEKLRINCCNLSEYHRKRYYHFKGYGKYFRIPLIILASINSTASVGLQPVLSQPIISGITCIIGMIMGILGAIELYLGIQTSMDLEMKQSKEFYSLAIDIYKTLSLQRSNRSEDGKEYLNVKYAHYIKLCEASEILNRKIKMDMLANVPNKLMDSTPTPSLMDFPHQTPKTDFFIGNNIIPKIIQGPNNNEHTENKNTLSNSTIDSEEQNDNTIEKVVISSEVNINEEKV